MKGIGALTKKISIQQMVNDADDMGGFTQHWTPLCTTFADIKPLSANELLFSQKLQGVTTHKITIRHQAGVSSAMRVALTVGSATRYFQINGVINVGERNRYMTLLCKEGVGS